MAATQQQSSAAVASPAATAAAGGAEAPLGVQRNAKGGVLVDRADLQRVFNLLDSGGKGYITKQDLKEKLGMLHKTIKPSEYQYLLNKKGKLTFEELYQLLAENELREYDPLKEAFAFFDAEGTGSVDPAVLRAMLEEMGAGPVSDEDMDILLQHADLDKDGRIGLHDFCHIVYGPQRGVDSHADFASKSRTTANVSGDAAPPAAAATQ